MKFLKLLPIAVIACFTISCGSKLPDSYNMEKRYWDVDDYKKAIRYMKYSLNKEEGYPRLSDPVTAPVFEKLVDKQNVSVVLEDEQLGWTHRNNVAEDFFSITKDLKRIYRAIDIQDDYLYGEELVHVTDFTLHTQLLYFKIGEDKILAEALDPNDRSIKSIIRINTQTLISNFVIDLELLAEEEAFDPDTFQDLAQVIKSNFELLIESYPTADYQPIIKTAKLVIAKTKSPNLHKSLNEMIEMVQ